MNELCIGEMKAKPAGNSGFIHIGDDGHFYSGNERVRFFGAQIPPSLMGRSAEVLGKRLSTYGFNLCRSETGDILPWKSQAVEIRDGFFTAMMKNGIYHHLILRNGGHLLWAAHNDLRLRNYFDLEDKHIRGTERGGWYPNHPVMLLVYLMEPSIVRAERKTWRLLLEHVNPFTQTAYKDETGILCFELINESYLLGAWEMGMLGLGVFPEYYEGYFQEIWNRYLVEVIQKELNRKDAKNAKKNIFPLPRETAKEKLSLKRTEKSQISSENQIRGLLEARWDDGTGVGLLEDEDPVKGTVKRLPERPQRDKGNKFSRTRTLDLMAFYAFLQRRYFDESRKYLREIGCKVPVAASNWSQLTLPGLETLDTMDMVDTHIYFDLPTPETKQGRYRNHNMFETYGLRNNESILASNALLGKPLSVSETGWSYPNEHQCQFLPDLGSYASLQDWDSLILFIHAAKPGDGIANNSVPALFFENNPLIMTQAFFASRVFRAGLISGAEETLICSYDQKAIRETYMDSLTGHGVWPAAPYPLGNLMGANRDGSLPFEIALKHKVRKRFVEGDFSICLESKKGNKEIKPKLSDRDLRELMDLGKVDSIQSDTGQIISDKKRQLLLVNAPCYKSITGKLEGTIELGSKSVCVDMKEPRYASISLLALDENPVSESGRLLLSTVARVRNTGMKWDEEKHYVKEWGKGPVLCENVPARVSIKVDPRDEGFTAWALDGGGRKKKRVPCAVKGGVLQIMVGGDETVWYLLEKVDRQRGME